MCRILSFRYLFFIVIILFSSLSSLGGKINVRISPGERNGKIEVGSKFYIEIEAVNCSGNWNVPKTFGGAELLYTPSQNSSSISSSDGYRTVSQKKDIITYYLLAKKPGTYSFGPVSVGNTVCKAVKYTIYEKGKGTSGGASGTGTSSSGVETSNNHGNNEKSGKPQFIGRGNEDMFLRASVSKTKVYEQEALVYSIKLFTTYNYIKFLGSTTAPKFDGFVVEETKIKDANLHFESVNGKMYEAAEVARYIIFPQKAGKLSIKGNTYTISADAFEYYHDPVFASMTVKRPVQLTITPNDLEIDVKSLPTPIPADFSGGVGNFTISSSLPDRNIKTNKASNIIYKVSGSGNLKYLKLPELKNVFPAGIETFTPEAKADTRIEGSTIIGDVVFTCPFMPMETGNLTIPELNFVFFNPQTEKYETVVAKGYSFKVGKGTVSERSQSASRFDDSLSQVDTAKLKKNRELLIYKPLYWGWFIVPLLILIGTLIYYRKYLKDHSDMVGLKSKRAGKIAKRRLRKARKCLENNEVELFYDEMLAALWGFLSDKLKMPTSELSRSNVKEVLLNNNIYPETADKTIELLDKCEFAKYAPSHGKGDMSSIFNQAVEVIETLNTYFSSETINEREENSDN